jgi:hypothetical protein
MALLLEETADLDECSAKSTAIKPKVSTKQIGREPFKV